MLHYEVLMLTTPTITQDETKEIESGIERLVKAAGGIVTSFDRWGKYRLAYPVKKNEYGIYYLARFDIENSDTVLNELRSLFAVKLHEMVMRHIISALEADAPSVYLRPQSLEETPERSEGGLTKRNIERIITTSEARKSTAPETILAEAEVEVQAADSTAKDVALDITETALEVVEEKAADVASEKPVETDPTAHEATKDTGKVGNDQ